MRSLFLCGLGAAGLLAATAVPNPAAAQDKGAVKAEPVLKTSPPTKVLLPAPVVLKPVVQKPAEKPPEQKPADPPKVADKPPEKEPTPAMAETAPAALTIPYRTRTGGMEVVAAALAASADAPFTPIRATTAALEVVAAAAVIADPTTSFTPVRLRTGPLEVIAISPGE